MGERLLATARAGCMCWARGRGISWVSSLVRTPARQAHRLNGIEFLWRRGLLPMGFRFPTPVPPPADNRANGTSLSIDMWSHVSCKVPSCALMHGS